MTTSRPTHLDSFNNFIQKKINAAVRTVLHKTKATIQELQNEIKSKDLLIQDLEQIIRTQEHREQEQRQQEHRERAFREQEQRQQEHRERALREQEQRQREQYEQEKRECVHRDQSERDRIEHCARTYHEQIELETRERERLQLEHCERVVHEHLEREAREARELERRELEQQKLATQFREWVLSNEDIPPLKQQELLHQEHCVGEYRRVGRVHANQQQIPHIYRKKGNQLNQMANNGNRRNSSVEFNHKMNKIKSNGGQHARGGIVPPEDNSSNHIL